MKHALGPTTLPITILIGCVRDERPQAFELVTPNPNPEVCLTTRILKVSAQRFGVFKVKGLGLGV